MDEDREILKTNGSVIARSEATPAHPDRGGRSNLPLATGLVFSTNGMDDSDADAKTRLLRRIGGNKPPTLLAMTSIFSPW
jgi:hypothetical protein